MTALLGWCGCGGNEVFGDPGGSSSSSGGSSSGSSSSGSSSGSSSSGQGGGGGSSSGQAGAGGTTGGYCGDGLVGSGETCDDANNDPEDGCHGCQITTGYECDGEPSSCQLIEPLVVETSTGLDLGIGDNDYDGTLGSMTCVDLGVTSNHLDIQYVMVHLGLSHDNIGDLVIKVRSPLLTVTTLMSRPGLDEGADDGGGVGGESSDLVASYPIEFRDDAPFDAEAMGDSIGMWGNVCEDDGQCQFFPNPGAGPGTSLADFNGESPVGDWRICVGDAQWATGGSIDQAGLTILAW